MRKAKFKCYCGREFTTWFGSVKNGGTRSCGCWQGYRTLHKFNYIDGRTKTRLWKIFMSMWNRTTCKKGKDYKNYVLRGITVCIEWENFEPFRDWALKNGYEEHLTIDRKNNDLGYTPDNCRWATNQEQLRNRRNNSTAFSKYKGVGFRPDKPNHCRKKPWHARIRVNGKLIALGCFKTELEAAIAYNEAAKKYFGEFAYLNPI